MDRDALVNSLSGSIPIELAENLVDNFIEIRRDVAMHTLGRSAPGKFVEAFIQILQHLETGTHNKQPDVDEYIRKLESRPAPFDDGLRICASRIARGMYTLRNKRNIAHLGDVDPNTYDLRYLLAGTQWILAELIRVISTLPMEEAGELVAQVQRPIEDVIEVFGNKRIVLADLTVRKELLILLHSVYPTTMTREQLIQNLDRRHPDSVGKQTRELWKAKLIEGNAQDGYKLTKTGYTEARKILTDISD